MRCWETLPPPALQLQAIGMLLGVTPRRPSAQTPPDDALAQAARAGLPIISERPDDPMLDLVGL